MPSHADEDLVDQIYEAALIPDLWPAVLGQMAGRTGSIGAMLFVTNHQAVSRWTACEGAAPIVTDWIREGWPARNTRPARMFAEKRAGWVTEAEIYTPEELLREPDYLGFYHPRGLGHAAGTGIFLPSGDLGVFDIQRARAAGPIGPAGKAFLDGLRPHLGRAALMAARLELERIRASVALLATIGLPAAVLTVSGRVVAANALLDALQGQVIPRAFGCLGFHEPAADALLQAVLSRKDPAAGGSSIPLPALDERPPAVAHVLPMRGMARELFANAHTLVVVTPLTGGAAPDADLLGGLFDLTPAEARVARGLAEGRTLDHIAAAAGTSLATVRTQLRHVMGKTGTSRQAEIVALLAGARRFAVRAEAAPTATGAARGPGTGAIPTAKTRGAKPTASLHKG